MGKKSKPAAPTPVYVDPPDNSAEMALLQEQIDLAKKDSMRNAAIARASLAEAQRANTYAQQRFEEQLRIQQEQLKAPKDVVLGTAPTNIDFKTFTPSTPDAKTTEGLASTRLSTGKTTTPTVPTSKQRIKDPLGLGITGLNFGLNT
jgi:hypothetical protein